MGEEKNMFEPINLTDLDLATLILIWIQSIQDKDWKPPVNQVLAYLFFLKLIF